MKVCVPNGVHKLPTTKRHLQHLHIRPLSEFEKKEEKNIQAVALKDKTSLKAICPENPCTLLFDPSCQKSIKKSRNVQSWTYAKTTVGEQAARQP